MSQYVQPRLLIAGDVIECAWCNTPLTIEETADGKFRIPLPEHVNSGECETAGLTDKQIAEVAREHGLKLTAGVSHG
jgi:hypothetical protein